VIRVLFVCTGNICRSPMAQGYLDELLRERGGLEFQVESAGVFGWEDSPAANESVLALQEQGIDISSHVARRLNRPMVERADVVVAMAAEHRDAVVRLSPASAARTFTLKELVYLLDRLNGSAPPPGSPEERTRQAIAAAAALRDAGPMDLFDEDVGDPLGLGIEAFRATAWEIGGYVERLVDGLLGSLDPDGPAPFNDPYGVWSTRGATETSPARAPQAVEAAPGPIAVASVLPGDRSREAHVKDYAADWDALKRTDPEIAGAIAHELDRERSTLRLIASENYASPAVLAALASSMNNKYAEGYPGKRYYGGCEFVDVSEGLAIERVKQLFGAEHANVQPHAGAQANLAVYGAFLQPHSQDKVLGLVLAHGGHLTHGSPVNVSGKWFTFVGYEVDKDSEVIDMDRVRDLALEHRPKMILAGFTAYPRSIDFPAFRQIADEVGALFMVDASHFIGLVAGGAYADPVPHADVVTFTTHKTLRGPRGAVILSKAEHAKAIDKAVFPMMQGGPLEHVIAAKAVCFREAMQPEFKDYAARTVRTARALAAGLEQHGLRCISGGTDSHLALIDLQPIGMTGAHAEDLATEVGIALNKNAIPFDPLPPGTASGIRVGTPGPATLGMDEPEMAEVAQILGSVLRSPDDEAVKSKARAGVKSLMDRFPVYPG
jgi:glycine hydroxymethyltransferase